MNEQAKPALRAEDRDDLPVHPAADVFPMLAEDELDELAADIKKNGLRYPLVVQEIAGVPTLIDGRNRREACRRAGVAPEYRMLNGQDAAAYIVSANINRRHMTVGQRAMAVAMILPEEEEKPKGGRGKKSEALKLGGSAQFKRRINEARFILLRRPLLASLVLSGSEKLDTCYQQAKEEVADTQNEQNQLRKLRADAPDLATQVEEGECTLEQANRKLAERREQALISRRGIWLTLNAGQTFARAYGDHTRGFTEVSGHWDEFSASTACSRGELIALFEQLYRNLPRLIEDLKESED